VLTAKCGKEGLELAEKRHPRIMLLDWRMPEMTGPVVLGMMKRDDHLKHIPVIMVTARSMMEDVETAFDLGVKDYIVKPLSLKQLSAKVAAVLSKEEI
jgi:DNA-binding response OmpR family regulator